MENTERDLPIKSGNGTMKGAIIGGLIGAVAALLFAPKSGRELRGDLRVKAGEATEVVKAKSAVIAETAQNAIHAVGEQTAVLKDKVKDFASAAKQRASATANQAHELVDTVTEKARETANVVGMRGKDAIDTAENMSHDAIDSAENKAENAADKKTDTTAKTAQQS